MPFGTIFKSMIKDEEAESANVYAGITFNINQHEVIQKRKWESRSYETQEYILMRRLREYSDRFGFKVLDNSINYEVCPSSSMIHLHCTCYATDVSPMYFKTIEDRINSFYLTPKYKTILFKVVYSMEDWYKYITKDKAA